MSIERGAPIGLTPKAADAIRVLTDGIEAKQIWNVEYEEANQRLSREFEKAAAGLEDDVRIACRGLDPDSAGLYGITNSLHYLTSVNAIVRDYEKFLKKPKPPYDRYAITSETIAGAKRMLEFARSWVPVLELKKEAKAFVVKGRKPSGKPAEERYSPPMSSRKSLARVEKTLRELVESKRVDLKKLLDERLWGFVQLFFQAKMSPYQFFKMDPGMAGLVNGLAVRPDTAAGSVNWSKGAQMKPDARRTVEGIAKREAQAIVDNYVGKNLAKLTRPIAEREARGGALVRLTDLGMKVDGGTFQGWIELAFSDRTGFKVLNKMIFNRSSWGRGFVQFPTTFHEVVFRNGTKKAMQSEEQMNKDWLAS